MDIIQKLTEELQVKRGQVEAAVKLIDEGNTIPFISRYRKEATGALNDEQLRNLDERLTYLRNLEEKKAQVISSIEEQGKLTDELKKAIEAAQTPGSCRRPVPPISSETPYPCDHCKGKRTGRAGKCDSSADDQPAAGGRGKELSFRRERGFYGRGGHCRSNGYYCREHFR